MSKPRISLAALSICISFALVACGDFMPPEPVKKTEDKNGKPKVETAISKSVPSEPVIGARLIAIGHPNEFMGESFIAVTVDIANNSDKPITSIKGHLDFITMDGLQKFSLGVDAQGQLDAKSITRVMWKWSSWSGDGISVRKNDFSQYTIVFVPTEISLSDGTKIKTDDIQGSKPRTQL